VTARLLARASPGEVRVAAEQDGALLDYAIWRPGAPDGVGDLHVGRVTAMVPAMAGAFVALEGAEGFLPDSQGGKGLTAGTILGVRVTRAAQGGKGPRLTARLQPAEREAVRDRPPGLVRRGPGALERLGRQYPEAIVLTDDTGLLARLRPVFRERIAHADPVWDDAIEAAVAALAEPEVVLPGGIRLSIHPTPALVAIDIDAGGVVAERRSKTGQHIAVNRLVLPAVAAQIRLRNLSGAILVDFAGLGASQRATLGPALSAALAGDPLKPRLLGFTALGLAEIVRPRVHPPLHELLAGPHPAALSALRAVVARARAEPGWPPALRASPAVVRALEADKEARSQLDSRLGGNGRLAVRSDPSLGSAGWALT
jgi:Ribonuclease G/E